MSYLILHFLKIMLIYDYRYLKDFIDLSFSHIYDAKTNSLKTKESNEDVRKYTSGKFAMLSSEIEKVTVIYSQFFVADNQYFAVDTFCI